MPDPLIPQKTPLLKPRFVAILIGILLLVILGSYSAEYFYKKYIDDDWSSIADHGRENLTGELQSKFAAYQERTVAATKTVAYSQALTAAVSPAGDSSLIGAFSVLAVQDRMNLSFELYDGKQQLLAWSGTHGAILDSSYFTPDVSTCIIPGPILSYFITVVPVVIDGKQFYVAGKRLFDVNYPISNRFISNQAFATTFTSRFPFDVEFYFSQGAPRDSGEQISVPLMALSKDTLGFVYVQAPVHSEFQDNVHDALETVVSVAIILLCLVLMYLGVRLQLKLGSRTVRAVIWTVGIWGLRYVMLWRNVPQCLMSSSLFDASFFASPFGFGLAKSIADLLISSLFLLANVVLVVVPWLRQPGTTTIPKNRAVAITLIAGLSVALFFCLRGYFATVSSAVLDSSLPYGDPTFVFPSVELAMMLVSLMFVTLSLVIAGIGIIRFCHSIILPSVGDRIMLSWILTFAALGTFGIVFGALTSHPLLSQVQRLVHVGILCGLAYVLFRLERRFHRMLLIQSAVAAAIVAISFLLPQLDRNVHELDRVHAELLSSEIVRPSDTWINIVMQRALDELSNGDAVTALSVSDRQGIDKLAFTQWAKSILSREGDNCAILIFDQSGNVLSNFQIGISPFKASEPFRDISPLHRYIDIEEQGSRGDKRFMGYSPVFASDGAFLGGVWVELATGRQSILRNETINLLKNYSNEHFETHYRKLSISEYLQGRLVSTSDELIPLEHRLPEQLRSQKAGTVWLDETIDRVSYETLYINDQTRPAENSWIALRMSTLDLRWHVFSYLRYILFYAILIVAMSAGFLAIRLLRRRMLVANFKFKLLSAFMIVSVLPIGILAYYNRQYVMERAEESTQKRLSEQTALVLASIQRDFEVNAPFTLLQVSNAQCSSVADRIDCDFILYDGKYLQASSKPEIFTAELLDERLSADAFVNIMMKKKSFYSESRSIGSFPYIVGYRPITTESGAIIGVVSVPTLFRQSEIDEELTQRNVLLFGAYALALILSLGVGTFFANQISSPILRLKDATKRLAGGDWNVRLRSGRKDELGELERSFDDMARKLQESQEQMLAAQREAAWKEMAKQVAHEIKNPLTPIKLSIQHLRRAYSDNIKDFGHVLQQVSATILQQIETLSRIASEFSHFARMPERKLVYCDVHEILDEAKNLFDQHKSVIFMKNYQAEKGIILVDREELRRAFINILRNAIQAMREKGTITLHTTSDVDIIEISITDSGPGIPPAVKGRLFEPNFSTKTDGMGLGLSIVKKTVDDLGGTITIDSQPGSGTTVTMKLLLSLEHE